MKSLWNRLRMNLIFFRLAMDPTRTELIFKAVKIGSSDPDPEVTGLLDDILLRSREFASMFESRYLAKPPTMEELGRYPEGTFGHALHLHLRDNGLTLDLFPQVRMNRLIDYMTARMYQDHDLWHVLLGYGVGLEDELAIQAFSLAQYRSPLGTLIISAGLLNLLRKRPAYSSLGVEKVVEGYRRGLKSKFLLDFRLHDLFGQPLSEVRALCGIDGALEHQPIEELFAQAAW